MEDVPYIQGPAFHKGPKSLEECETPSVTVPNRREAAPGTIDPAGLTPVLHFYRFGLRGDHPGIGPAPELRLQRLGTTTDTR